jgi:hypothetical protein
MAHMSSRRVEIALRVVVFLFYLAAIAAIAGSLGNGSGDHILGFKLNNINFQHRIQSFPEQKVPNISYILLEISRKVKQFPAFLEIPRDGFLRTVRTCVRKKKRRQKSLLFFQL